MSKETITIESYLPLFAGFYGSQFECDCEELYIDEDKTYDDYKWDYKEYNERVARAITIMVGGQLEDLGITTKYQKLISPKYYNYTNDSIDVEYTLKDDTFKKLVDYCKDNIEPFTEYLEDNFKSYDGFMSFFNYDTDTWFNEYLNIEHEKIATIFGSALDFYLYNEEYTMDDLFEEVQDELHQLDYELVEVTE